MSVRNLLTTNTKTEQDVQVDTVNCNTITSSVGNFTELNAFTENISATTIECTTITAGTGNIESINTTNLNCEWTNVSVAYPNQAVVDQLSGLISVTGIPVIPHSASNYLELGVALPGVDTSNTTILVTMWADNNVDASQLPSTISAFAAFHHSQFLLAISKILKWL